MASLLYFLDDYQGGAPEDLAAVGLGGLLPEGRVSTRGAANGPGGRPGTTLGDATRQGTRTIGYQAAEQEWRLLELGGPPRWVGWWKDAPPTPEDLRRDDAVDGPLVPLIDGQRWLVPRVREWRSEHEAYVNPLPRLLRPVEGGWERGDVVPALAPLWDAGVRAFDLFEASVRVDEQSGEVGGEVDVDAIYDCGVEFLAANHYVDRWTLGALGVLDEQGVLEVVMQAISWRDMIEHLTDQRKKKEAEEVSASEEPSNDGAAA